jgi:hypothetical protein
MASYERHDYLSSFGSVLYDSRYYELRFSIFTTEVLSSLNLSYDCLLRNYLDQYLSSLDQSASKNISLRLEIFITAQSLYYSLTNSDLHDFPFQYPWSPWEFSLRYLRYS